MLGAALRNAVKARADGHALDGVQPHHHVRDVGVQAVVDGFAPARGQVFGHDFNARADGIAIAAQLVHIGFQFRHDLGVGCVEGVVGHFVPGQERDGHRAQLAHVAAHLDAVLLGQPLLGDGARRDRGRRQAGR
ncbi:hypothetical protein D3C71_1068900 [compost metagenome]